MIFEQIRNSAITIGITILLPLTIHMGLALFNITPPLDLYFYITAVIGVIAIIIGTIIQNSYLGAGLILGGTICLLYGYIVHWSNISDTFKFISFLIALVVLIIGSFKFMKKS